MPRQTEPNANNALEGLLRGMLPRSTVRSENTQAIAKRPGLKPDILITEAGRSPVVIEAEFMPAATVEPEAKDRLGLEVAENGRIIEAVIALRYPADVADADDLRAALSKARLFYCLFTEEASGATRFPESGWLEGSVEDLADMVRLVSVPQRAVNKAASTLEEGIEGAAKLLNEMNETRSGITMAIARLLGMTNVPQTRRMACAIVANALVFHGRIAGMHDGIRPLAAVCGDGVANPQGEVLAAWDDILEINYWPIFCHRQGHPHTATLHRGSGHTAAIEGHRPGRQRHRRGQRPRPDWPRLPAAYCRPQVPGYLLHAPRVRRAPGPARRR